MSRRQFNEADVLEKAMTVFLQRGYRGTSLIDLTAAMGIGKGSLYPAFKSKRDIFLRILKRSMFRETSDWKTIFEHPGPAYGRIREFFDYVVENCCGHAGRYGWLITNTTVEMAPHDSEIRYLLALHYRDLGEILVKEIERLKREDTKKGDLDGRTTAKLLITTIQGLRVTAKTEPTTESVREIANFLLFLTLPDPSRQSQPFPSTSSPTD